MPLQAGIPVFRAETWSVVVPSPPTDAKPLKVSQRANMLKKYSEMPETRLEPLPKSLSFVEMHGKTPQVLTSKDMLTSSIHQDMAKLKLGEHFDAFGKPRFRKLGLTFAAKQMLPAEATAPYSSTAQDLKDLNKSTGKEDFQAAKAFIMSQEAVAVDMRRWKKKSAEILQAITEDEKFKDEDVKSRQLNIYFLEVDEFMKYMPPAALATSLVPTLDREDEERSRFLAGRALGFLEERGWLAGLHMSWRFNQAEVQALSEVMKLWSVAAWGAAAGYVGMERATFCRFILDIGLVDQRRVPYFWAVSLFDQISRPLRCAALDDPLSNAAPLMQVANRWELITIVELLIDQHIKPSHVAQRARFLQSLLEIAKSRLPAFILKQSELEKQGRWEARLWGDSTEAGEALGGLPNVLDHKEKKQAKEKKDEAKGKSKRSDERVKRQADPEASEAEQKAQPSQAPRPAPFEAQRRMEEQSKNQRLRCMLVEPEVLQLLWQHEEVFRVLHKAYADESGNMDFHAVAQLCADYCMVPTLITMHALEKLYKSCECLEKSLPDIGRALAALSICEEDIGSESRSGSPKAGSTSPRRNSVSTNGRRNSRRDSSGSISSVQSRSKGSSPLTAREPPKRSANALNVQALHEIRPPSTSSSRGPAPSRYNNNRGRHGSKQSRPGSKLSARPESTSSALDRPRAASQMYTGSWPPSFPWEVVSQRSRFEEAAPGKDDPPQPSVFGHAALMELLCKVAFNHLSFYGNMQQRSMDGLLQTVWLLIFLRNASESFGASLDKRGLDREAEEARFGAVSKAVRSMHQDLWNLPPAPTFEEDNMPATTWRPLLPKTPESLGLLPWNSYQDPLHLVGSPCILLGRCNVCESDIGNAGWGNIRCYGCSKVDTTAFKRHPLAVLLIDRPPGERLQAPAVVPGQRVRRASLSPVGLKEGNSLTPLTAKQDWDRLKEIGEPVGVMAMAMKETYNKVRIAESSS